ARRPPTSPLFPYTTLFRSLRMRWIFALGAKVAHARDHAGAEHLRPEAIDGHPRGQGMVRVHEPTRQPETIVGNARGQGWKQRREDRKSTRLNSSHLVTSYA